MKDWSDHGVDREGMRANIRMDEVHEADLERRVGTLPNTLKN